MIYLLKTESGSTEYMMWYSLLSSKGVAFDVIKSLEQINDGVLIYPFSNNDENSEVHDLLQKGVKLVTSNKSFFPTEIREQNEMYVSGTLLNSSVLYIHSRVFKSFFPTKFRIYYSRIKRILTKQYHAPSMWELFHEQSDKILAFFSGNDYIKYNKWPDGYDTAFCLSFDCDYKEDFEAFEKTCHILNKHEIPASFAIIGKAIEEYPNEHEKIVTNHFEIVNHTYSHPDNEVYNQEKFIDIDDETKQSEMIKAQTIIKSQLKYIPVGFRTPHFGYNVDSSLFEVLEKQDFIYDSSIISNNTPGLGNPYYPSMDDYRMESDVHYKTLVIPVSACPACGASFDTWHSIRSPRAIHKDPEQYREIWKKLIDKSIERGTLINTYVDPQDFIKEEYQPVFEWVFDYIKSKNIWITRMDEVAKWWMNG